MRKKLFEVEKLIKKNESVRGFEEFLNKHSNVVSMLGDLNELRRVPLKAYLKAQESSLLTYCKLSRQSAKRKREIEEEARNQKTRWAEVIDIFNSRFFVPFDVFLQNKTSAVLGGEIPTLGFSFREGSERANVQQQDLMTVLS